MNMHYKRSDRVSALIQEEIGNMLLTEVKDPDLHDITITKVELTDDLRYAKIYFSILGDEQKKQAATKALERSKGFFRSEIGRRIKIRFAPEIRFFYDDAVDYANHIESLLKKINDED